MLEICFRMCFHLINDCWPSDEKKISGVNARDDHSVQPINSSLGIYADM